MHGNIMTSAAIQDQDNFYSCIISSKSQLLYCQDNYVASYMGDVQRKLDVVASLTMHIITVI